MKTSPIKLLLAAVLVMSLSSCALFCPPKKQLAGCWTNALGTTWTIHCDGTFDVALHHHKKRDAWGTYTVAGDVITIHATGGYMPRGCQGDGVYHFKRSGSTLQFTLVKDACKIRAANVLKGWQQCK
jgi:hypothetical protein